MKIIARILIILLAASVVVGAAWALTRNSTNVQFAPGEGRFRPEGNFNGQGFAPGRPSEEFSPGQRPEGFREGGFDRGRRGGFIPFGWIRNIGLIAVIVAVVLFIEFVMDRRRINVLRKFRRTIRK